MSDSKKSETTNEQTIKQLWALIRILQEENERLKEKVRAFYGT